MGGMMVNRAQQVAMYSGAKAMSSIGLGDRAMDYGLAGKG